jgi:hypothetical protein
MEDTKKYIYYIYKLCYETKTKDLDYIYIGSTNNTKERYANHISNATNLNCKSYNNLLYTAMRDLDPNNFKMVIIHTTETPITKTDAHIIEETYRISEKANLNECRCYRTEEEKVAQLKDYYNANKQKTLERQKNYYAENIVEIKQKRKQYRQDNKAKKALQARAYYLNRKAKNTI